MKLPLLPVAILVRVSTDRQATARQTADLQAVAYAKSWEVVEVIEETITGRANAVDRNGLTRLGELVEAGRIKKVLVHEVSRLSRRPAVVHAFVEQLEAAGISLYWHAQGIETLMASGKRNPAAAIMLALLAEARRKGVVLGRKVGSTMMPGAVLAARNDIVR